MTPDFPKIHLIRLKGIPIFEQLQLEEALLRADDRNFCIINYGAPRAVVMGISNKAEALLYLESIRREKIPVVKRFSGGGTVIVDPNTLFVTFIMSKKDLNVPAFPEPILKWGADLYTDAWAIPGFNLRENDYCVGEKKCGGNAQYIKKDRWLHHTSFLWDYSEQNMAHLRLPSKRPKYREDRDHGDFLVRLKSYGFSPEELICKLERALVKQLYIEEFNLDFLETKSYRESTHLVEV